MLRQTAGSRAKIHLLVGLLATSVGCSSSSADTGTESSPGGASGGAGSGGARSGGASGGAANAGASGGTPSAGGRPSSGSGATTSGGRAGGDAGNAGTGAQAGAAAGGSGDAAPGGGGASGGTAGSPDDSSSGGRGAGAAGSGGNPPSGSGDLIVAPDGKDDAAGTLEAPTTLTSALTRITAGHTIFARDGRYAFAAQVTIARGNSGSEGNPKRLAPYASEHPVLDFSSEPYGTGSNPRGLQIDGSHWNVRGLEVTGAADNGIYVSGNDNVLDACVTHGNRDTGLQLGRASSSDADMASWPSNNLILDCESYDNYDAPPGSGENADGFAAKLTVGTGNVFRGCVSHNNIDDGWDLYTKTETGPIGPVTIDQCVSYANGTLTDGTSNGNGDRNGFKLGGDDIAVAHVVTRSIAFKNGKNGFTWNSNPGAIRLSNDLAFDNAEGNFKFGDNSTSTSAVFTNNVSFWTATGATQSDKAIGADTAGTNAWWDESTNTASVAGTNIEVTAADFARSLAAAKVTRNADMSLDFSPFALAPASDLVDAGVVPAGTLPFDAASYYAGAPDLGAVEAR
jgi:hypothetical protein